MPVHHQPQPLKTPLLCWHESLASARNDALVALSADAARIATTRPLAAGTVVYLELEAGAGIDAIATALDATGFIVEFVTVDDAAGALIARTLRDNASTNDGAAHAPNSERPVSRPTAILSPPTVPHAEVPASVEHSSVEHSVPPSFGGVPVVDNAVAPVIDAAAALVPAGAPFAADVVETPAPRERAPEAAPAFEATARDEVSIADALRFELDDNHEAVAAPAPASVASSVEATEPPDTAQTPAPAPIVEPFDDLHSDDLIDAAFAHYRPAADVEQPDFDGAFQLPHAGQAALDAAAEAAFLANDDIAGAADVAAGVPRTRTEELFGLPAAPADPAHAAPASLARSSTALLFDMPHTVTMGSLPVPPPNATQDLLLPAAALSAEAWAQAMAEPPPPPVASAVPPAKETTDKWPVARAISAESTGGDVSPPAPEETRLGDKPQSGFPFEAQVAGGDVSAPHNGLFDAPEVTAPGAHAVAATSTGIVLEDGSGATLHAVAATSTGIVDERAPALADATWKPIGQAFDDDDTHIDPVSASDVTVPAVVATPVNDVASDDFADGFDVAFTNPGIVLASIPRSASEHAIELELDDDEIELDHRPNLTLEPADDIANEIANAIADDFGDEEPERDHFASTRPLPEPELEHEPASDDAPRVVDVDFSEFRDVLGATRRVYDALLPSLLPGPPPGLSVPVAPATTTASLSVPQPPPSLLLPMAPAAADAPLALPRPPGSRNTGSFGLGAAGNPFGGDPDARNDADSVPPPPPPPRDEPWTVSLPPSPAFPAPRLLDADFAPVLHAGAVSFTGDSLPAAPPTTLTTTVSPLTPGTPDDLPLVVGDQVLLNAEDLVDDDWQIGPSPQRR